MDDTTWRSLLEWNELELASMDVGCWLIDFSKFKQTNFYSKFSNPFRDRRLSLCLSMFSLSLSLMYFMLFFVYIIAKVSLSLS